MDSSTKKIAVHFSSMSDHWSTPDEIYLKLDEEFSFDFDPCPLHSDFDGLSIPWGSMNFVNPPYSKLAYWLKKAKTEQDNGNSSVLLIPARTDTKAWHDYVMKADEIRFLRGRLKFGGHRNSAPFPSAIVIFKGKRT